MGLSGQDLPGKDAPHHRRIIRIFQNDPGPAGLQRFDDADGGVPLGAQGDHLCLAQVYTKGSRHRTPRSWSETRDAPGAAVKWKGRPRAPHPSCRLEIDRRGFATPIRLQFVGDTLLLIERPHARTLDSRDMNKGIAAAIFGRDEAIALIGVEEFHGSSDHKKFLSKMTGQLDAIQLSQG
jgi:hypothetical protein